MFATKDILFPSKGNMISMIATLNLNNYEHHGLRNLDDITTDRDSQVYKPCILQFISFSFLTSHRQRLTDLKYEGG